MNFLRGQVQRHDDSLRVKVGDLLVNPANEMQDALGVYDGQTIYVGIRAENMETLSQPSEDALSVTVEVVEPLGAQNLLTAYIEGDMVKISTHPDFPAQAGGQIWLRFPVNKIRWIDRDTGKAIMPDLEKVLA
jgi:multiple sugar transport system ATP-binding protein